MTQRSYYWSFWNKIQKERIYKFQHPTDYVKLINQETGVAEIQGDRSTQEDVLKLSSNHIEEFKKLSPEERTQALEETVAEMQNKYGNINGQGSTLCHINAWFDQENRLHTYTTYVGDSSAYLVILNDKNEVFSAERLNKHLHNPPNDQRLSLDDPGVNPFETNMAFSSTLALNRTIGDREFESVGLSHAPNIEMKITPIPTTFKTYVLLACDGLTEGSCNLKVISDTIAKNSHLSPDKMAEKLVLLAYQYGSNDNISIAVMKLGNAISASIFDGHGGNKVSMDLGKYFYPTLEQKIQSILSRRELIFSGYKNRI